MNKTPLEDFTTELLVGTLETDNELLDEFVNNVLLIDGQGFSISSQVKYYLEEDTNCIIDIVVKNEGNICFIENKIDSSEGERQLDRYSKVLNNIKKGQGTKAYLRYCTKYYDKKEISDIDFLQYRWRDTYRFFEKYKKNKIVEEYLEFLRSEGMESAGDFNFQDLIVMSEVNATIAKMDECLDMVKPRLTEAFGKPYEYDYERLKQVSKNNQYVMWSRNIVGENGYSEITVGFRFNDNKIPVMIVFISIENDNSEFEKIKKMHTEKLENVFDCYDYDETYIYYSFEKPVSDFISSENQNEEICKWFTEKINIINELKQSINIMWN
ncbi:PD-(D/E)XK nuclease family protein [Clostridium sp. YIM B02505]|uniref:PD-(D/E)XK nuclease family protein n=1 Tax=Clostridium yunnanense TaxID=2800325 RepID=A0ABS1EJG4_9CLOT|nr:PD-(D/E)XK nuclease family protein [Clostridium yunnanense]MBK1809502.1 PD-(D/E)XK nuclease family protein [Clostridium yunnanense]